MPIKKGVQQVQTKKSGEQAGVSSLLQAAFDGTEAVCFIVNAKGLVMHFNRKAYENSILLHNKEIKRGDNLLDFASDARNDVRAHLKSQLDKVFSGETFREENEVKYNSQSRWFQTEYVPVILNQQIVAASISIFDITRQKNHNREMTEVLADLKSINKQRLNEIERSIIAVIQRHKDLADIDTRSTAENAKQDQFFNDLFLLLRKVTSWKES